jgi:hypothetical protein
MRRIFGADDPRTLLVAEFYATTLGCQGNWTDARRILLDVYSSWERTLGEDHVLTLKTAMLLEASFPPAEVLGGRRGKTQRLVDQYTVTLGSEHPITIICSRFLASALALEGRHGEAEAIAEATFHRARRVLGPCNPAMVACLHMLMSMRATS